MAVSITTGTLDGGVTPICNECGVSLCWDIAYEEYVEYKGFWDKWICEDCNGGIPLSLKKYKRGLDKGGK